MIFYSKLAIKSKVIIVILIINCRFLFFSSQGSSMESGSAPRASPVAHHPPLQRKYSPAPVQVGESCQQHPSETPPLPPTSSTSVTPNAQRNNGTHSALPNGDKKSTAGGGQGNGQYKIKHQSPIPERKHMSKEKEEERRDCKVRNYSPQAFKFFMEQHVENVLKSHKQRVYRRFQLETEMQKIGLSAEAQCQMRKMLSQKESNYIRLVAIIEKD